MPLSDQAGNRPSANFTNPSPTQKVLHPLTSSHTGTFYFAYGSNLSPSQMTLRLPNSPTSSIPIAIARLDCYRWIICQRGYANVVALPPDTPTSHDSTVWGVLYNLTSDDEAILDRYEGHDEHRNPNPDVNPDPKTQIEKPYEQGNWDYNKFYLPVTVTKWLVDPAQFGVDAPATVSKNDSYAITDASSNGIPSSTPAHLTPLPSPAATSVVRTLIYIDEYRTSAGRINFEYIGRMNRAISESLALGYPSDWVDAVMRKYIVPDVHVREDGYVGTDKGYIEAEATEAYDEVTENAVRAWRERQEQDRE